MIRSILVFSCMLFGLIASAQSTVISRILKEQDDARTQYWEENPWRGGPDPRDSIPYPKAFSEYYVYPSILRAVNYSRIEMWDNLSMGLEEAVYINGSDFTTEEQLVLFKRIGKELREDGFETWIEMTGANMAALHVKSDGDEISNFVIIGLLEDRFQGLDFRGKMTPEQLMELRNIDMDAVQEDLLGNMNSLLDL